MYLIKLDESEIKLPSCWEEVTFNQLLKLRALNVIGSGNIHGTAMILGVLMDMDYKKLLRLDADSFVSLAKTIEWVHTFSIKEVIKKEFNWNGVNYKLVEDFNKLSIGEVASAEQFIMEDAEKNADKIMAILVREIDENGKVKDFDADEINSRAEVIRNNMTIAELHGLNTLFFSGVKESTKITQGSLAPKIMITPMTTQP